MALSLAGVAPFEKRFHSLEAFNHTAERIQAFERFAKRGLPSLKDEAWRYTSMARVAKLSDQRPQAPAAEQVSALVKETQKGREYDWAAHELVFVNGRFSKEHSRLSNLPSGANLNVGIASTLNLDRLKVESPFVDLNQALSEEGFKLNIDAELEVEGVILVRFIGLGDGQDYHTRSHIVLGAGAKAQVVEEFSGQGSYLADATTFVEMHENAELSHTRIQDDDKQAINLGNTQVVVKAKAVYKNFALNMGAQLARNEIRGQLADEKADLHLIGANLVDNATPSDGQHLDTTTFIDHAHADTTSNELYKSVLRGHASCVFQGKIEVQEDSQRIVGNQMSRALMLSDKAQINTKPELEIYADDVICSHGATVGDLDEEAKFYLRSRGISADIAESLLVRAFVDEVFEEVENQSLRDSLKALAEAWF